MNDRPDRPPGEDEAPRQRPPEPVPVERSAERPIVAEPRDPDPAVEPEPVRPVEPVMEQQSPSEPERHGESGPTGPPGTAETLGLPPTTGTEPAAPSPSESRQAPQGAPVPFAAPPSERDGGKFALRLILGIVGGVLLIAAIVGGFFASLFVFSNSVIERVETTAEEFIEDVADERWDEAHESLCPELREDPVDHYVDEWRSWEADDAEVLSVYDSSRGDSVPVRLGDGRTIELNVVIDQDGQSIGTSVCGWRSVG